MAYCAKADLVQRFGGKELAELTDETAAHSSDDTEIAAACDEASSLIDSYISTRYTVPLDPVPAMVRKWACDIAFFNLFKISVPERVKDAYEDAIARLKDVAKGVAGLPDATGTTAETNGAALSVVTADTVFTDDLLGMMPG